MAQHDQNIANNPGVGVRSDINSALAALFSNSSGNTEPTVKVAGQLWFDTSVAGVTTLKVRDQTNASWITIGGSATTVTKLTVDSPTGSNAEVVLDKPSGTTGLINRITGSTNGVLRWGLRLGDATSEAGSNAGSDLAIVSYADSNSGPPLATPLTITRSTGLITANLVMPTVHANRSSVDVSISAVSPTWTKVSLQTMNVNAGGFTLSSGSLVIPKTGIYLVGASALITAPAAISVLLAGIGVNGAAAPTSTVRVANATTTAFTWMLNCQRPFSLTAGNTLELLVSTTVATATALAGADTSLWATMVAAQ